MINSTPIYVFEEEQSEKKVKESDKEKEKQEFLKIKHELTLEKNGLGYGDVSLKDFLNFEIDSSEDQYSASQIIDLQNRVRNLFEYEQRLFIEELVVEELNKKHAVVHTDRFFILTEKKDPVSGCINFTLESRQSFRDSYENQIVQLHNGRKISKADIWLRAKNRRQYDGISFNPDLKNQNSDYYNIWKGLAVAPKKGCCEKLKEHIKKIICSGNQSHFHFVFKWCARLAQEPHKPGETALVLMGEQGTGKNTFVDALGKIFGGHYLPLDNIDQLLGKFNFHLKNAVLIHGNEALWGGNRKEGGKLKAIITERNKIIEGKGRDAIIVPNFTHLIISTNEDWPVHLDNDDRRFFILKVSNKHKEDKTYFKAIHDELEHGGLEAFLFELLQEDLSGFNHREFPQTDEAFPIKLMSATSCEKYIFEILKEGSLEIIPAPSNTWPEIVKKQMYEDYTYWCENNGEIKKSFESLGRTLKKLIPSMYQRRATTVERSGLYCLPSVNQSRKEFEKSFKVSSSIWDC